MNNNSNQKQILITGTSSGIGNAAVNYLKDKGFYVYAGVRAKKDFALWKNEENVCPVILDVTKRTDINRVKKQIQDSGVELYALINNAGVTCWGPFMTVDEKEMLKPFQVNLLGTFLMIKNFYPLLSKNHARIINIGSSATKFIIPTHGPYPVAMAGLSFFTHGLRREFRLCGIKNIKIVLIEPGSINTNIWQKARKINFEKDDVFYDKAYTVGLHSIIQGPGNSIHPTEVAKTIYKALTVKNPRVKYHVGPLIFTLNFLKTLSDKMGDKLIITVMNSMYKKLKKKELKEISNERQ